MTIYKRYFLIHNVLDHDFLLKSSNSLWNKLIISLDFSNGMLSNSFTKTSAKYFDGGGRQALTFWYNIPHNGGLMLKFSDCARIHLILLWFYINQLCVGTLSSWNISLFGHDQHFIVEEVTFGVSLHKSGPLLKAM